MPAEGERQLLIPTVEFWLFNKDTQNFYFREVALEGTNLDIVQQYEN